MKISKTALEGLMIIEPDLYEDERGYFYESFNEKLFGTRGIDVRFVQDNESRSLGGVIRGLHYQLNPYAQTKLLRVLEGSIFDVAVDIRKGSPTFGKWMGIEISSANKLQLLIPKGFAHGFKVLTPHATVFYKCDNFYNPEFERSILFSDPGLNIDWGIDLSNAIVSEKDRNASLFGSADINFKYN